MPSEEYINDCISPSNMDRRAFLGLCGALAASKAVPAWAKAKTVKPVDYERAAQEFAALLTKYQAYQSDLLRAARNIAKKRGEVDELEDKLRREDFPRPKVEESRLGFRGPIRIPEYDRGMRVIQLPSRTSKFEPVKRLYVTVEGTEVRKWEEDFQILSLSGADAVYKIEVANYTPGNGDAFVHHIRLTEVLLGQNDPRGFGTSLGPVKEQVRVVSDCKANGLRASGAVRLRGCTEFFELKGDPEELASLGLRPGRIRFSDSSYHREDTSTFRYLQERVAPHKEPANRKEYEMIVALSAWLVGDMMRMRAHAQHFERMEAHLEQTVSSLEADLEIGGQVQQYEFYGIDASDLMPFKGLGRRQVHAGDFDRLRSFVHSPQQYRRLLGMREMRHVPKQGAYSSALTTHNGSYGDSEELALHFAAFFVGKLGYRVDSLKMWEGDRTEYAVAYQGPDNKWGFAINGHVSPLKFGKRWQAIEASALHVGFEASRDKIRTYRDIKNVQPGPWLYHDHAAAKVIPK